MNITLKDRHLFGAGAAACAVCCAVPLLALLGVAGAAATVATFMFAGVVFGVVVATDTVLAAWRQRGNARECWDNPGPVDVEIATTTGGSR
ncbi:MAG: hypothetical protein ABI586_02270 [Candidatus Nanopelagicales bacterium]